MELKDIFRYVRTNDIHQINNEYVQIKEQYNDIFIGEQMMRNDLCHNLELWADMEQAMMALFQFIERNSMLKQDILGRLHLSADIPTQRIMPPLREPHLAEDLLKLMMISFYRKAYSFAVAGDTEAFRNYALDYRITSGLKNKELSDLLQRVKELSYCVELDEINVKYLWHIYQKDYPEDIGKFLYRALVNRIFRNESVYVEEYLECVFAIDARLKREV